MSSAPTNIYEQVGVGLLGAAGTAVVTFIAWLVREKLNAPSSERLELKEELEKITKKLSESEGREIGLRTEVHRITDEYLQSAKTISLLLEEIDNLKKEVSFLKEKIGEI
jgi:chromosome segregation ATPase